MIDSSPPRRGSRVFVWVARFLGRVESRLVLSAAIIISLLPFDWVGSLDAAFLALFTLEFVLRGMLTFRGENLYAHGSATGVTPSEAEVEKAREWQWPSTWTWLLLICDLLALLSFVPSLVGIEGAETRWLRLFRLTRMLLLLSYWAPLVRDVWTVMLRRERAKQVALMGAIVLALSFAGAVVLEQVHSRNDQLVDYDGDDIYGYDEFGEPLDPDDQKFFVHLWWSFRQVQDPGNMLASPSHAAAVIVSLGLTVSGLFMVSFLIGLGTDVVQELMVLARLRPPGLRGHTIIVNINVSTQQLLHELLGYSRKLVPGGRRLSWRWIGQLLRSRQKGVQAGRFLVIGRSDDPPDFLRQPELARITYRQASVEDETFLVRADVLDSQRVVLLADFDAADPDAATIQALLTITGSLRDADEDSRRRDSLTGQSSQPKRARLLIAEVLDESNIPAARAAITGSGKRRNPNSRETTRAFVVPSERLIALFMACVTRRPGVGQLLEALLTSSGQELYTMFFDLPGLSFRRAGWPELPADPSVVMGELIRRARSLSDHSRVVPVGVLMSGDDPDDVQVFINPKPDFGSLQPAERAEVTPQLDTPVDGPGRRCVGFVALAENFLRMRELAEDIYQRPREQLPAGPDPIPQLVQFERSPTTSLRQVLICGFRSNTVSLAEALIQAEPTTQILIMVADEQARSAAWDDFDAHTKLVARGLLEGHHGQFRGDRDRWALTWLNPDDPHTHDHHPHVHLVVGDWSSSRQLTALPLGFGNVGKMDAVILISSEHEGSDARVAKTLMKLETLTKDPRIVAEVLDVEFARRLRRRGAQQNPARVSVYSIQELRALFMFQSVVVPAFDVVYAELMGPWGQSLVRLQPSGEESLTGTCTFEELADHLSLTGRVLIAIERCNDREPHVHGPTCWTSLQVGTGDEGDEVIELDRLTSVWVASRDHSGGRAVEPPDARASASPA